ncbi:MAG: hypothetical protein J0665_09455 [Deltaproteobacteria bacterium]|nr:hypothetical protein [Deltaproteobacteria bacterium]
MQNEHATFRAQFTEVNIVRDKYFEFDSDLDQGAIIHIVGVGDTGLCAVSKMAGRIHNVECIGVQFATEGCSITGSLPMVMLTKPDLDSTLNFEPLMKTIENSDLVFLVSDLNEGRNRLLLDICTAVRMRSTTLILVVPEPLDDKGQPVSLSGQVTILRATVDGMIIVSGSSLTPLDPCAPKVFDDTTLLNYLIRHAIEKVTDIITTMGSMCIDLADVLTIIKGDGMIRFGTGIASGTDRGIAATGKAFYALKQQGVFSLVKVTRLLCCITGSGEMTMDDYNSVSRLLHVATNEDTNIKIGISRHDEMGNNLMVTIWAVIIDHHC